MKRPYYRKPRSDYFVNALTLLRKEIVREELDGLEHVDALLVLRGVDPETIRTPRAVPNRFKRGELTRAILSMLREQPMKAIDMADRLRVAHPCDRWRMYNGVNRALYRLRDRGVVKREGRVWRLAP